MHIYIPTRGRADHVPTIHALPTSALKKTWLVVRPEERNLYENYASMIKKATGSKPKVMTLTRNLPLHMARQEILEHGKGRAIAMMDDDIRSFLTKPRIDQRLIRPVEYDTDLEQIFTTLEAGLLSMPRLACISTVDRVALSRPATSEISGPSRAGQCMFIRRDLAVKHNWRFDRIEIYHDQDFALQILKSGFISCVSNRYGHNMRQTYHPVGGLQTYRDQNLINRSAEKLMKLHPGLVKLKWKDRAGFKVPSRIIQWKKAYAMGVSK